MRTERYDVSGDESGCGSAGGWLKQGCATVRSDSRDEPSGRSEPRGLQKFIAQRRRDFDGVELADGSALKDGVQREIRYQRSVALLISAI